MSAGARPLSIGTDKFFDSDSETMPEPFSICLTPNIDKNVNVLTGMFVELAQLFWGTGNNFVTNRLPPSVRWSKDPASTGVAIAAAYNFSEAYKDPKCMIGVSVGPLSYTNPPGTPRSGCIGSNQSSSEQKFAAIVSGTVTLSHVGTTDGQSVTMADESLELFRAYASVIRTDLDFISLNVVGRTPLTEKPVKWYGSPRFSSDITLSFTFGDIWVVGRESPKLRELIFSAGQPGIDRFIIPNESAVPNR